VVLRRASTKGSEPFADVIRALLWADVRVNLYQLKSDRGNGVPTGPEVLANRIPFLATSARLRLRFSLSETRLPSHPMFGSMHTWSGIRHQVDLGEPTTPLGVGQALVTIRHAILLPEESNLFKGHWSNQWLNQVSKCPGECLTM